MVAVRKELPLVLVHINSRKVVEIVDKAAGTGGAVNWIYVKDNLIAPGMMKRHYATSHELFFENDLDKINLTEKTFALRFKSYADYLPKANQIVLSEQGSLAEAAANLFAKMRELDAMKIDKIIAERFPQEGIGRAINDRLERAASKYLHS